MRASADDPGHTVSRSFVRGTGSTAISTTPVCQYFLGQAGLLKLARLCLLFSRINTMPLALSNLDTGLFFAKDGWTTDLRLAQTFTDRDAIINLAVEKKLTNAAIVLMDENPPRAMGFFLIRDPN